MTPDSWRRVDEWWSDLFGVPATMLWRDDIVVGLHAGLGDYPGFFVAERDGRVHVSLPDGVTAAQVRELEAVAPTALMTRDFWDQWSVTADMVVLGPAVHAFTDVEPDIDADLLADVVVLTTDDLDSLRGAVGDDEWDEGGFAHVEGPVHALLSGDADDVVAAAHLSGFLGGAADLGVLVHPDARGRGLGALVGGAATCSAVRTLGLARWRARVDNAPSRALSRALGFEDHCRQLAVRPAD